jgi:hypothetical protein
MVTAAGLPLRLVCLTAAFVCPGVLLLNLLSPHIPHLALLIGPLHNFLLVFRWRMGQPKASMVRRPVDLAAPAACRELLLLGHCHPTVLVVETLNNSSRLQQSQLPRAKATQHSLQHPAAPVWCSSNPRALFA